MSQQLQQQLHVAIRVTCPTCHVPPSGPSGLFTPTAPGVPAGPGRAGPGHSRPQPATGPQPHLAAR
jgi:hypothetical protein